MSKIVVVCVLWLSVSIVLGQEMQLLPEKTVGRDTTYAYWESRYYKDIKQAGELAVPEYQRYEDMISHYQGQDFEYIESISNKLNFIDKLFSKISKFIESLFPARSNVVVNENIWTIVGIGGGVLFLFLLYKLIFTGRKIYINHDDEANEQESEIQFVERNLMSVDVRTYIDEALKNQQYALAIRYRHLLNIQSLTYKGIVNWNHSKTNVELMEDVSNQELRNDFLKCASIFDYVWFGDFEVNQADYNKYEAAFKQFQKRWA